MNKKKLYRKIATNIFWGNEHHSPAGFCFVLVVLGGIFSFSLHEVTNFLFLIPVLGVVYFIILCFNILFGRVNLSKKQNLDFACVTLDEEYKSIIKQLSEEKVKLNKALSILSTSNYFDNETKLEIKQSFHEQLEKIESLSSTACQEQQVFKQKFSTMLEEMKKAEELEQITTAIAGIDKREKFIENSKQSLINLHMLVETCCNNLGQLDRQRTVLKQSALPEIQEIFN